MKINSEDRIKEKLAVIDSSLKKVDDNLPEKFNEFSKMGIEKDGVYKNVETAIQSAYDICAMIVKEEDLGVPEEESGLPDLLEKEGILEKELVEKLKDMKGFRNALAHRYGNIDDEVAYENINEGLQDFQTFKKSVIEYLEN